MNSAAGSFLKEAKKRSSNYCLLKLKAILPEIKPLVKMRFGNVFAKTIGVIRMNVIDRKASSFFWLSVHRLYSSLHNKDLYLTERNLEYFAVNYFDSFFKDLPNGLKFCVPVIPNNSWVFPSLNLCLRLQMNYSLEKVSGNCISLTTIDKDERVVSTILIDPREIPASLQVHKHSFKSHNNLALLFEKSYALFEESYYPEINGDHLEGLSMTKKVDSAFAEIKRIDADLYYRMVRLIKYIVPIGNYKDVHFSSFSSPMLKDCLFTSIFIKEIFLIESLIHEFSHCELHYIMDTFLISKESEFVQEYYSPWRRDPRPVNGIIHGVYVFHSIAEFYTRWFQMNIDAKTKGLIKKRLHIILSQVQMGIRQLEAEKLTPFTIEMFKQIDESCKELSQAVKINRNRTPKVVRVHQQEWMQKNPEYKIKPAAEV